MSQIVTGFTDMKRRSDQRSANRGSGDFIRTISLKDDQDSVMFRLVTESDIQYAEQSNVPHMFIQGEFHREQGQTKSKKTFYRDVLCKTTFNDDTNQWEGECDFCADPDNRARTQFFAWAYVYAFYYKRQDERYIPGDDSTEKFKRNRVRRGTEVLYKEDVNQYCIWQDGWFMLQLIQGKVQRFGVLCDRDYMVTRHGIRRAPSTQRVLDDMAPSPMSDEIREGASELPSLPDVASNKVRTMGGKPAADTANEEVDLDEDIPEDVLGAPVDGFSGDDIIDEAVDMLDDLENIPNDSIFDSSEPSAEGSSPDDIFDELESMVSTSDSEEETVDED